MTWRTTKTVTIAAARKVRVATSERGESRARPQTPWPLVQPLPSPVPSPTSRPAASISGTPPAGAPITSPGAPATLPAPPPASSNATGPLTRPSRKASRQALSPRGRWVIRVPRMPLMPAMRPRVAISQVAERPIRTPPISPCRLAVQST